MDYISSKDLGQSSSLQLPFMKACVAELMCQWDKARLVMKLQCRRDDTVELLALCAKIPDLTPDGAIDRMYLHFKMLDATTGGNADAMLKMYQQLPQGGSGLEASLKREAVGSADGDKKKKSPKKAKKGDKAAGGAASAASSGGASSSSSNSTGSGTSSLSSSPRHPLCCYQFNSVKGCSQAGCKYTHENPKKATPEAIAMAKELAARNWTPSADFLRNSQ
jgi:hypothetical protein